MGLFRLPRVPLHIPGHRPSSLPARYNPTQETVPSPTFGSVLSSAPTATSLLSGSSHHSIGYGFPIPSSTPSSGHMSLGLSHIPFFFPLFFLRPPVSPFPSFPCAFLLLNGRQASAWLFAAAMTISALMLGCSCCAPMVSASVIRLSIFLAFPSL